MWPEPIPLRVKLYGNLEELRTVAFVKTTYISVKSTTTTKKKKKKKCTVTGGDSNFHPSVSVHYYDNSATTKLNDNNNGQCLSTSL